MAAITTLRVVSSNPARVGLFSGRPIQVLLPPLPAEPGVWTCATSLVWQLTDAACKVLGMSPPRYVCEHDVEID